MKKIIIILLVVVGFINCNHDKKELNVKRWPFGIIGYCYEGSWNLEEKK